METVARQTRFGFSQTRGNRHGLLGCLLLALTVAGTGRAFSETAPAPPVLASYQETPNERLILPFLERRVAGDRDDYVVWNRLGEACLRRLRVSGDLSWFPRAAEAARRSLAAVPASQNTGGLLLRARVEQADHRFVDAAATARQLKELVPGLLSTWETLGDACLEAGEVYDAAAAYREMANRAAGNGRSEVESRLARLALARGDRAAARAAFGRALALAAAPEETEMAAFVYVQLGRMDFEEGHWPEAGTHYRRALAAVPSSAAAFVNLAELAGAGGDSTLAESLYRQLIEQQPRPEFCHELADYLIFLGRPDEAKPWAERALAGYLASVDRGERMYFHHLAAFFADTRESPDDAVQWAGRDLEQRHGPAARDALAWALSRQGRFPEAAAEMNRALATAGAGAASHILGHAGLIFLRAGDPTRGVECQRRAQELNPNLNRFHAHR